MNYLRHNYKSILLILLILVSLLLRFYRIGETQTFLEDEGRDLLIAKRMIDTKRPVLIGPQTSTGSMYLGPFYYYFITPALMLSNMNPVGPAILIAITGALTVYLLFRLTKSWFGELSGWVAATLYAVMPLPVNFTRNSWNPNLAPLIALIMLYFLDKVKYRDKTKIKWFFWVGIFAGLLIQLHYMALTYLAIIALLLLYWWVFPVQKKYLVKLFKAILIGLFGFVLSLAPFFVFELRNDWVNTKAITRFVEAKQERNIRYDLPLWLWEKKVVSTSKSVFGGLFDQEFIIANNIVIPQISIFIALTIFLGIIASPIEKRRKQILLFLIFGSLATMGIYQENIHPHYLGFLFAIVYLGYASIFSLKNKKILWFWFLFTLMLVIYNLPITIELINSGPTFQTDKAKAVAEYIEKEANNNSYNIASNGTTSTTPYQYYAFLEKNPPSNTAAEDVFLICEGSPCTDSDINNKQIFITGPSHPTLTNYIGHPLATYIVETPMIISNDHVKLGVWVAHLKLKPLE